MTGFAELPGAVTYDGVVAHFGSPFSEQRELAAGRALVDLGPIGLVRIEGADRLSWLDSLTSQRIRELQPGESAEDLLLDANGRIEFGFGVLDDGQATWLLLDAAGAEALSAWLNRMRFMLRVSVEDRTGSLRAIAAFAPIDLGAELVWSDPWAAGVAPGGVSYAAAQTHPGSDFTLQLHLVDDAQFAKIVERVRGGEFSAAGVDAFHALRIAAWRPIVAIDGDDRAIAHEFDLLRTAVHLDKGCYRGQETIAKVHNLGHPPRRLTLLDLDGSDDRLPEPGALISREGDATDRPVGRVTSVAHHYEEGPIALALLKRNVDADARLTVEREDGRTAASQVPIVSPDAGRTVDVSQLRRRR